MRIKRQSKARKAIEFYSRTFSFESPYKFLLDPDFIFGIIKAGLPLRPTIENLIGETNCKIFLTTCIKRELEALSITPGPRMGIWKAVLSVVENNNNKIQYIACRHEKKPKGCSSHECIIASVLAYPNKDDTISTQQNGTTSDSSNNNNNDQKPKPKKKEKKSNPEHLICCAQHSELRTQLREIPAVPIIFLHSNVLVFDQPSKATIDYAARIKTVQHNKISSKENLETLIRLQHYAPEQNMIFEEAMKNGGQIGFSEMPLPPQLSSTTNITQQPIQRKSRGPAKGANPLSKKKPKPKQMPTLRPKKLQLLLTQNNNNNNTNQQAIQPNKKSNHNQQLKNGGDKIVQLAKPNQKTNTTTTTTTTTNNNTNNNNQSTNNPKKRKLPQ